MEDETIDLGEAGGEDSPADFLPNEEEAAEESGLEPEPEPTLDGLMSEYEKQQVEDKPVGDAPAIDLATLPEPVQESLGISEYVTDISHMPTAVRAASEMWDVEAGKTKAYEMLEGFRARNPERFAEIINKELVPYLEHITGKKLGGQQEGDPNDPNYQVQQLRREMEQGKLNETRAAEQRAETERITQANEIGSKQVDALIGQSQFAGQSERFFSLALQKMGSLKLDPQRVMQETLRGDFRNFDKAVNAVKADEMKYVAAVNKAWIAQSKALRGALPAGKKATTTAGSNKMSGWTKEQQAEYIATGNEPT